MTGEKRKSQQQPLSSDDASTSRGPPKRHQKDQKPYDFTSKEEEDETLFHGKQNELPVDTLLHRNQKALTVSDSKGHYKMERGAGISQPLLSSLVNRFGDELSQEAHSWLLCVLDQAEWVENECRWMQAFLKDAEDKPDGDERVKQWTWEVRELKYLAEDTFDTCLLELARSTDSNQRNDASQKLVSEIERMKDKMKSIRESRLAYGIQDIRHEERTGSFSQSGRDRRLLSPHVEDPDFVGFQADLEELMQTLTKGEPRRGVISIVGMGGQGKTTIARKLYQSDAVKGHFDCCAWISVSQVYGVAELLQDVTRKCKVPSAEGMDADELRHEITQHLKGKRYLVVLDDVWTREAWDDLKDAFPNTSNGSRVLLTTRDEDVALHADPRSEPHKLRLLDKDESWQLFLKKARPGCEVDFPMDWEETRKEILSKCQGLPLAIAVIGGLLSRRKHRRDLQNILKSVSWQLIEGEDGISGILSLSYIDLPYYLKRCFLYLGVFPEDREISIKKLIRLWAAEGFLQERGALTLEEIGEECFGELVRRSLIQLCERSYGGSIKRCRIHDLLRDFILFKAEEYAFLDVRSSTAASKTYKGRRLAVHNNEKGYYFLNHFSSNLRSLFIHHPNQHNSQRFDGIEEHLFCRRFKMLRVLDIEGVFLKILPSEIGDLILLRYLCLKIDSGCWTNIGNLVNLQTLCISLGYRSHIRIPNIILKMQQLRHVVVRGGGIEIEEGPFLDESCKSNLETLETLGVWEEKNFGWLGRLTKLRKLKWVFNSRRIISYDGYMTVGIKGVWESMMTLESLESLSVRPLYGYEGSPLLHLGHVPPLNHLSKLCKLELDGKIDNPAAALREFPRKLTKLLLTNSQLEQDPLPILEKLEYLRILKLCSHCYGGKKMTCSAGGFPRLQSLVIWGLFGLREWRVEKGSMPSLLHLRICCCSGLMDVPDLQHVPTLKKLDVWRLPSEFKEKIEGEDGYKIEHVRSVHIFVNPRNPYLPIIN